MGDRSVNIRLSVTDGFSQTLDSYNQKMDSATTNTQQAGTASEDTGSKFGGLGRAVAGAFTLAAAKQIVDFGIQMTNLGTEVNDTKTIFDQLAGSMGDADTIMQRIRDASLNSASDNSLRTSANALMRMGLAENPEELEQIIGMVTRLKKPTDDLGTAMDNFSLMMANQSVLRLDSFGLSSGRVRDRINELLESGQALNREEAFKMAVLEEGARAIERLGDAATTATNPLVRMEVAVQNLTEQAASNISMGVQGTAGIIEIALGLHPEQIRQAEERAALAAESLSNSVTQALAAKGRGEVGDLSDNFINSYINNLTQAALSNPELANDMDALRRQATQMLTPAEYNMPTDTGAFMPVSTGAYDQQLDALARITMEQINLNAQRRAGEAALQAEADAAQQAEDIELERLRIAQDRAAEAAAVGERDSLLGGIDAVEIQAIEEAFRNIDTSTNSIASAELPKYLTEDQADNITHMADEAQRMADELAAMAEERPDLISTEQVENAQATADSVRDMAEQAEKAADAFDKMKLSEIFGQTGGGTLAEINDMVLEASKAAGATAEQIDALQRTLDMSSGRETTASLYVSETLIPEISAEADPETVAAMTTKLNEILRTAMLEGVDVNNEDFLAGLKEQLTPEALLGEDFDAEAFVAPFVDAATQVATITTEAGSSAEQLTIMGDESAAVAAEVTTAAKQMGDLSERTKAFGNNLAAAFAKQYTLRIDVQHNAPGWLAGLIGMGSLTAAMAAATRDNGGTPPGTDTRANR